MAGAVQRGHPCWIVRARLSWDHRFHGLYWVKAGDISAEMLGVEGPSGSLGKHTVITSLGVRDGMAETAGHRVL